jgi:hypothetical protein
VNRPDDDFDDFLKRRKHVFRGIEDPLEPPDELDRLVLHQAREAVQADRPERMYKGPRFVAPIAIAATLVLAVTVILNVGMPAKPQAKAQATPEVTVQSVAQRVEYPAAQAPVANNPGRTATPAPAQAAAADARSDSVVVQLSPSAAAPADRAPGGFVSEAEASRYARSAPPPSTGVVIVDPVTGSQTVVTDFSPPPDEAQRAVAKTSPDLKFRSDARTWLAEIERLRAEGKGAQAEAEYTEYKRQHRAYAVSPDR